MQVETDQRYCVWSRKSVFGMPSNRDVPCKGSSNPRETLQSWSSRSHRPPALGHVQARVRDEVAELRARNEPSFQAGRLHAYYSMLFVNAMLAQSAYGGATRARRTISVFSSFMTVHPLLGRTIEVLGSSDGVHRAGSGADPALHLRTPRFTTTRGKPAYPRSPARPDWQTRGTARGTR